MLGIDYFDAILNIPQVAILAVSATTQRQAWNDGDPAWQAFRGGASQPAAVTPPESPDGV